MRHGIEHSFTAGQIAGLAFAGYANYQVFKWIFLAIKDVVTSDLLGVVIFKLTPASIIKKREVRIKLKIHHERIRKEKEHQKALESHRKYKAPFFNLQYIGEDRRTLFRGYEDIKWLHGNKNVGESKMPWVIENHMIARDMFQEMAAYRWEFQKQNKWTPEMEKFWIKILPKKFISKEKEMTPLEKAMADFDEDIPTKASA